ncbi:MAG: ThiF family adenylyltransferase [Myxococcales bacterium]|nr:ThiF family adenylyltransferase [Myxococcales bacterium]
MTIPPNDWRHRPIAIVGCGGLGVPAAWTLALGGARHLRLIDADTVELSNLHRQVLYGEQDVGQRKTAQLATALTSRFSGLEVEVVPQRLTADNQSTLLSGTLAVVEGTDDAACKFRVSDHVVDARRTQDRSQPQIAVIAAAVSRQGQWMTITPDGACYRCLFEAPPPAESLATCETAGVLGPVVGHIGAAAGRALARTLSGRPDPSQSALIRWHQGDYRRVAVPTAADCPCQRP